MVQNPSKMDDLGVPLFLVQHPHFFGWEQSIPGSSMPLSETIFGADFSPNNNRLVIGYLKIQGRHFFYIIYRRSRYKVGGPPSPVITGVKCQLL